MEVDGGANGGGGGDGSSEVDKKKLPEVEQQKVKRKMKTASQLEILEKTYAMEMYPSEAVRAELSVKLGLSDRQLQMWFCHRRLKDRKAQSSKQQQNKDSSLSATVGSLSGAREELTLGNELGLGPSLGSVGHRLDLNLLHQQQEQEHRVAHHRAGTAVARIGEMPAMVKRYYEPPRAISELRAIAFVEAQLGEPLREDGPILGMEFDPLPPGAFGAPIGASSQQNPVGQNFEAPAYERPEAKPIKVGPRAVHEYQFLPEQPSVRSDPLERAVPSHYYSSPADVLCSRPQLSSGRSLMHSSELLPSAYGLHSEIPSLNLLLQQGHHMSPPSTEVGIVSQKTSLVDVGMDATHADHPLTVLEHPFMSSDGRHDAERLERKRKSEEARIAREVEAHEKRIRKELEKQDILRRKREEQMKKEMERQDRERRKEEERLLREKQREAERYEREQRREMERREKFLQKASIRAEKMRLKEEMRREKEAARLKAASERASARRTAKESLELIDDERLELMELAASSRGLPSMLALDNETLQNLELFRDMLPEFPPKSVCLKRPFAVQPWIGSEENIGNLLMAWRFLTTFADVLRLWPFTLDEFVQAFHDYDARLLGEVHVALLRSIIKDIEDVARTPATAVGANNCAANPGGGHPQIVEGAYAWGFDIRKWQRYLTPLTWPEVLRQFALSAGFGPKLKKRTIEKAYPRNENEGDDGQNVISNLRNGAAAENAVAIMQERGYSSLRRSRHRVTPGTVKFAAYYVLSLEGSKGLTILEVADKIQKSGLRDLTTSKTPEASIAAALSRDTKLFERTAPSTYCVRARYRKDPADAEAILAAAREKIQVYKNGFLEGGEPDDVEKEDVDKDNDSESDVADDPEVDDVGTQSNLNEDALNLGEASKLKDEHYPEIASTGTPQHMLGDSMKQDLMEVKNIDSSNFQFADATNNPYDTTKPIQEDRVIDETNCGEPWVQGLTEGEYSDLSVEERLNALVALIGVANEGNSVRIVLEERLEAANALKKQIWAEAQLDKRRMKEDYAIRMQCSLHGKGVEQNGLIVAGDDSFNPLFLADGKNDLASADLNSQQPDLGDPSINLNQSNNVIAVRNPPAEFSAGPDIFQLQQSASAVETSKSQLKSYIGHRAEEIYMYRSLPLGQDRRRNRYWQFLTSPSRNDPGSGRIFVELCDGRWRLIDSEEGFDALLASLDVRGLRESNLHSMLQRIEGTFKESVRQNLFSNTIRENRSCVEKEMAPEIDYPFNPDSSSSLVSVSNSNMTECSSSFEIELGRTSAENNNCMKRYQDFEKWIWGECYSSTALRSMRCGKTRCKQLLSICDGCHDLFLFEDTHCPSCHRTYSSSVKSFNPSDHIIQCKRELKESERTLHWDSKFPTRIRLLKAQLVSLEVSLLLEALEPLWSNDFRNSWGLKLFNASSAGDLLQILTSLEGFIKRDFLSSIYETTRELLASCSSTDTQRSGVISTLPWIPETTSAVALRLMELDACIFYTLQQKEEYEKDNGAGYFTTISSNLAGTKAASEHLPRDFLLETRYVPKDTWVDLASGHTGSRRGRGRPRGSGRSGKSQARVHDLKSEPGQRTSRTSGDGLGELLGWKGQGKGRGGRRRGRRSTRRKKTAKKAAGAGVGTGSTKGLNLEKTETSDRLKWNDEQTTPAPVEGAEHESSSGRSGYDYNGQASGDEFDNRTVDEYSSVYSRTPGQPVAYGVCQDQDEQRAEDIDDDMQDNDADEDDNDENEEYESQEDRGEGDNDVEDYSHDDSEQEENVSAGGDLYKSLERGSDSSFSEYSD